MPFSIEADVPVTWECACGHDAHLMDGTRREHAVVKVPRSHWDMLLERRTIKELEELLDERLLLLRAARKGA